MNIREFWRFHFLKVLLVLIALQLGVIAFIHNYNYRPVAVNDEASVIEDRVLKINPLRNDSDKNNNTELTIAGVFNPSNGTVEHTPNYVQYTPARGFFGRDSIGYTVTDGKKTSNVAYIKVKVAKNLPPIAMNDTVHLYAGTATGISVLANVQDREGDSIYIAEYTHPKHGKLQKQGNDFLYSIGNTTAKADSFYYVASDGKNTSERKLVFIHIKSKNELLYPWLSADIGNAAIKGGVQKKGGNYIIKGSGTDIWASADGFHFLYQYVEGDCEMIVRVESLDGTHDWAKSGIMIRENLSGSSQHAMVCLSNRNGVTWHQRYNTGENTEGGPSNEAVVAPYWVKIVRKNDTFTFGASNDGRTWEELGSVENPMPPTVYIGLVVTSHNNNELATAEYSHLKLKAAAVK